MATSDEVGSTAGVARSYFDAVARRDIDAMVAIWEPGSLDVIHGTVEMRVPEDLRAWFGNLFAAFPDWRFEVLDVLASGEKAAVRWHATGTFDGSGNFEGLIPNGKMVDVEGCDVLTVRGGRVARNDAYTNGAQIARQLGALPPEGSLPERMLTELLNLGTRARARLKRA
jgi:steroid delta-isomerase-like uncharacterized protein